MIPIGNKCWIGSKMCNGENTVWNLCLGVDWGKFPKTLWFFSKIHGNFPKFLEISWNFYWILPNFTEKSLKIR